MKPIKQSKHHTSQNSATNKNELKSPQKNTSLKISEYKHSKFSKLLKLLEIPKSYSPTVQWILFILASILLILGIIFILYSLKTSLDVFERSVFLVAGIIALLVALLYGLVLDAYDRLIEKGIVFKIGMWSTLFGLYFFYPLIVTIPLWIIGAIFDI